MRSMTLTDYNPDDEATYAWDDTPVDPILASLHVEAMYAVADDDQPDLVVRSAQDNVEAITALYGRGLATLADVEAAWDLYLDLTA